MLAVGLETLNVVFPPAQKLAVPDEILGVAGAAFTVTTIACEIALVQPLAIARAVKVPACVTVISSPMAPLLHKYVTLAPMAAMPKVALPPAQKLVAVAAAMIGVAGTGFTVTITVGANADVQPLEMARTE